MREDFFKKKLSNIDLIRSWAAIAVLIWHYQHFFFGTTLTENIAEHRDIQPLYGLLKIFYTNGNSAVQLFWALSGFVFFHVYKEKSGVTAREFFSHRFSRLYPLHFLTFCLVGLLQLLCLKMLGAFQIYQFNDSKHFFLNLFFVSHWGFQDGFSFNAPIWSVSVEILVYALFFIFLRLFGMKLSYSVIWLAASLALNRFFKSPILECSAFFAFGGILNLISLKMRPRHGGAFIILAVALLGVLLGVGIGMGYLDVDNTLQWGVFPCLILLAVLLERKGFSLGRLGYKMGSITYSSYLIHVPVQLFLILLMEVVLKDRSIILRPEFLLCYILAIVGVALLVYKYVEFPLRNICLNRLMKTASHQEVRGLRDGY